MKLRRKLLTVFSGFGLLALATAGVTVWATLKWKDSNNKLEAHYQRSLLLQRVRATTFRSFKEVSDAVTGDDKDARQEFEELIEPVDKDFQRWAVLAENDERDNGEQKDDDENEKQQVEQIRAAYEQLVANARKVFDLVEAGRREEAFALLDGRLEDEDLLTFQNLTEKAVASDQKYRQVVQQQTQNTRQTAQLVLAIASFGTLSLLLLLTAYLASDLFSPLREVEQALDDLARGDLQRRLDEERDDELGAVNRAFNSMASAIAQRQQVMQTVPASSMDGASSDGSTLQNIPSRLMLHQLVSQLRSLLATAKPSRVSQLASNDGANGKTATGESKQQALDQIDRLLQAISRVTEFGFPLDLNLARTDIRALLYEVVLRFHDEFARRGISFDLDIAPEISYAVVDRLKLREVLGELVRNAIAALPESGGQLGIRSRSSDDGTQLLIEVADNGAGAEQPLINRAFANLDSEPLQRPSVGLKLTKAIVEQHGGELAIDSQPGVGTYVQIKLPLRE